MPALPALLSPALVVALALSVAAHGATYVLTPVLALHITRLGATGAQVGLLFSAMSLVAVVLRPAAGSWVDRYGVRPVLVPGVMAVIGASLALQAAGTPASVTGGMVVLGVGFGLTTMAAAVLAAGAPAEQRGRALSFYYLAAPAAMAAAAPAGVWLQRGWGMGANFGVVTGLGVVLLVLAATRWTALPRAATGGGRMRPWSRAALPLSAVLVVAAMGQSALHAFAPLHVEAHGQAQHLGWFFGLYAAALMGFRLGLGAAAERLGRGRALVAGLACIATGFGVLTLPPRPATLAAVALLLGAGSAALYPTLVALVVDRVPEAERGLAMGTVSGAWDLGVVIGSLTIGWVIELASPAAGFVAAAAFTVAALAGFVAVERAHAAEPPAARSAAP